ncbi:outer dynein arm-docking complex subunit 3-like isoform X3 [Physella acuta]|uniref:outer dynein arm-docking complex subunit 3-like isoform X1 n=1 Tax=Physella acuta TaxID=109671 RepID=UPI0027DB51A6|nr:outer dynein arm-docking complex subunit 3-like isoform X1 [Physella acuta]XP_059149672.1 outer dynein arm-docking complex subunit 3-like isoform X2 [Physella acuta]XP_059149673.1 outer dynein arm-docking complex subunit 3-like isoform X3 [Physella acuta]
MPSNNPAVQRPISEQIEELKAKISLLEGDRKAYYESSQYALKKNKEKITNLRKETKELRQRLKDKLSQDSHVISKAFHDRPVEKAALSNKSGRQAITIFDNKVCDSMKQLNNKRHVTARKQKKLEELQTQYDQMSKDSSDAAECDKGDSAEAQNMRYLENSYDKVALKTEEAKQVQRVYLDIKHRFEVESQEYPTKLDALETEIRDTRAQLKDLKAMHNDAQISKEAAVNDLRNHEETVYADRKKREIELQKMKKEAEEKKMQHERIEKRLAQRGSIQQDELSPEQKAALTGEDHQQKITTYEEAFRRIKECTGVSETTEVVVRFENQDDTTKHLEELKKENEKQIIRLREDKEKLQQEYEEMKYSGEAKLSSGQAMLEEFQAHLDKEKERRDKADQQLQNSSRILVQVKSGVEHLADKLHHIKATKGHVPSAQIAPTSNEYVLDQLSVSEEKLTKVIEELDGKDLQEISKQMEEEEFHASIEGKLPAYNTRVKLPQAQRDLAFGEEDDDSGEDDLDVPNRSAIKKQSEFIVESKTKRRVPKKKKKMK